MRSGLIATSDRYLPCTVAGMADAGAARAKGNARASPVSNLRMYPPGFLERRMPRNSPIAVKFREQLPEADFFRGRDNLVDRLVCARVATRTRKSDRIAA